MQDIHLEFGTQASQIWITRAAGSAKRTVQWANLQKGDLFSITTGTEPDFFVFLLRGFYLCLHPPTTNGT
jgi:hypothetical protein